MTAGCPEGESPADSLSFFDLECGGSIGLLDYCAGLMCPNSASLLGLMHEKQWG